jgi:hypothetical protein
VADCPDHARAALPSSRDHGPDFPQGPFTPHTSAALAAWLKSPYPHRSASGSPANAKPLRAERCRYGTRDLPLAAKAANESLQRPRPRQAGGTPGAGSRGNPHSSAADAGALTVADRALPRRLRCALSTVWFYLRVQRSRAKSGIAKFAFDIGRKSTTIWLWIVWVQHSQLWLIQRVGR